MNIDINSYGIMMEKVINQQGQSSEEVSPKKQVSKSVYIVVAALLVMVLGLGGYIAYDKYLGLDTSDDGETVEDESESTEESVSEDSDEGGEDEDNDGQADQNDNGESDDNAVDPYAGWKTYTNTTGWNLSFKYPSSAKLSSVENCMEAIQKGGPAGPCFATRTILDVDCYPPFEAFQIEAYDGEYSDLDERFDDGLGSPWVGNPKTGEVNISGYIGKYMTGTLNYDGQPVQFSKRIYVHTGDNLFLISWVDKESNPNGDIAEKMFDSLALE